MASVTLIDQIGGVEIKAKYADKAASATTADSATTATNATTATTATTATSATKDGNNNVISSTYCKTQDVQRYSRYSGGNGIVVSGSGLDTKTISSNIVELPLHSGTGILAELSANDDYAIIRALPEVYLYQTTSPMMSGSTGIVPEVTTGVTAWNNFGNDGTLGIDNSGITGLVATKLYRCSVRFRVTNTGSTTENVTITASASFATGLTETVEKTVISSAVDSLIMCWYVKGVTAVTFSATGLSTDVKAGIMEISISEVCDV